MSTSANRSTTRWNRHATYGLREPDWRWRLAMDSVPATKNTRRPDSICWHLCDYLTRGDEWISALSHNRRFSIRPILAIQSDRNRRLSLEARVLAFRDVDLAAKASHIDPQVAHDYCTVFFDVENRLDATRAIDGKIIHSSAHRDDVVRRELYWQAYFGGPVVAEHWLVQIPFIGCGVEHDLGTQEGRIREQLELIVASREPPPEFHDPKLMLVYQRLLDRDPQTCVYAECVEEHVTNIMATHWHQTPTKVAHEIVSRSAAA